MTWRTERSYTGYIVIGTDSLSQQSVSDLPGENWWTLSLVLSDLSHHLWCGNPGFTPSYGPRTYRACLIVPAQDLTHTAIRHLNTKTAHSTQIIRSKEYISFCLMICWTIMAMFLKGELHQSCIKLLQNLIDYLNWCNSFFISAAG